MQIANRTRRERAEAACIQVGTWTRTSSRRLGVLESTALVRYSTEEQQRTSSTSSSSMSRCSYLYVPFYGFQGSGIISQGLVHIRLVGLNVQETNVPSQYDLSDRSKSGQDMRKQPPASSVPTKVAGQCKSGCIDRWLPVVLAPHRHGHEAIACLACATHAGCTVPCQFLEQETPPDAVDTTARRH